MPLSPHPPGPFEPLPCLRPIRPQAEAYLPLSLAFHRATAAARSVLLVTVHLRHVMRFAHEELAQVDLFQCAAWKPETHGQVLI